MVYCIKCNKCNVSYVGQTKRKYKTRGSKHRNQINRNSNVLSVFTEHRLKTGHDFSWNDVKVLDKENFFTKRLISEMLHIKLQDNPINIMADTDKLKSYFSFLELFKTKL